MLKSTRCRAPVQEDKDTGGHCREGQGKLLGEDDPPPDVRKGEEGTRSSREIQASLPPSYPPFRTDQSHHSEDPPLSVSAAAPSVGLQKATWLNSATEQRSVEVIDIDEAMGRLYRSWAPI